MEAFVAGLVFGALEHSFIADPLRAGMVTPLGSMQDENGNYTAQYLVSFADERFVIFVRQAPPDVDLGTVVPPGGQGPLPPPPPAP